LKGVIFLEHFSLKPVTMSMLSSRNDAEKEESDQPESELNLFIRKQAWLTCSQN
jgi:hypothetical protein